MNATDRLNNFLHAEESELAKRLSTAELTDALIEAVWASIPARDRKRCAILSEAIDRLRSMDKALNQTLECTNGHFNPLFRCDCYKVAHAVAMQEDSPE